MDEVIEEFKGTGNSELILDRKVADKGFILLDITRSGQEGKNYCSRKMIFPK